MKKKIPGKSKRILSIIILAVVLFLYFQNRNNNDSHSGPQTTHQPDTPVQKSTFEGKSNISELTSQPRVVAYLKEHNRLPDYYMTKKEARTQGWIPSQGNLCKILPGKAIGGDRFGNREQRLPQKKGREYYEADLNYHCGRRGSDRVVYSNDHLIFVTDDHYNTFEKQ